MGTRLLWFGSTNLEDSISLFRSSAAERSKYTQSIPGFYRSRQSSAAERDRALRRRTESRKQRPSRHSGEENPGAMSEEEEVLLRLDSLQERELAEENERRMREQADVLARLLALEEEKKALEKAREEERKVREIERRAVEEWKVKNEVEEKARQKELAEYRDRLKKSLLKEHLSNDQIQSILENLNIKDPLSVGPGSGNESSHSSNRDNAQPITRTVDRISSGWESKLSRSVFCGVDPGSSLSPLIHVILGFSPTWERVVRGLPHIRLQYQARLRHLFLPGWVSSQRSKRKSASKRGL